MSASLLNPTRRHFLQTATAAVASWHLPRSLFAKNTARSFWFIHADTLNSWPIAHPVKWSLDHARDPILERASERLLKLTPDDGDRIIRLVVRRCRLNLLELHPNQVMVHHWGQDGPADLRPFFKQHGLARPQIEVVRRDRKKEVVTTQCGDDFLYGDRLEADFPLRLFLDKWAGRFVQHADDWQLAPGRRNGILLERVESGWRSISDGRRPWVAFKSAWRRAAPAICKNCDTPTILTYFGHVRTGLYRLSPHFVHVCEACRRRFIDDSVKDVDEWVRAYASG